MYADDVTAVVSAPTLTQLEVTLNATVQRLNQWFRLNGLALNRQKTCFMHFSLNGHRPHRMSVYAGDTLIEQVSVTKLLGFHIDSALVWETHIDEVCAKLGKSCFALRRLARTAATSTVRSCYFATVHSQLSYGTELWARAADWRRAFIMQKRAVRAMAGVPDDTSAREYFNKFKILPLPSLFILQIAVFTRENLHLFKRKGVSKFNLRSNKYKDLLVVEPHRLVKSEKSVYVIGPAIYNRLPECIKNAASNTIFKTKLKDWLTEKLFYNYEDFFKNPTVP